MRTTLQIAVITIAAWLSGCADTPAHTPKIVVSVPDPDAASRSITLEDARATLKSAAGHLCCLAGGRREITGIDLIDDDQVLVFIQANGDRSETLPVSALAVRVRTSDNFGRVFLTADKNVVLLNTSADLARKVADALVVIKIAPALKEQQATFDSQARAYRDATVKAVPGEDVRRFRIQAEAAVSDKRFQDAASLYSKGLTIAPWWPEGHFNAALILADLHQYREAADHMKKYLELVPDAPDARAAQDKIYVWEDAKATLPATRNRKQIN